MTGFDRLSYQSRWFHVAPERKFLFWLLLMVLAFTLPPLGQGIEMALIAALPAGCCGSRRGAGAAGWRCRLASC